MLKQLLLSLTLALSLGLLLAPQAGLAQVDVGKEQACQGAGGQYDTASGTCTTIGEEPGRDLPSIIKDVINLIIFIVGAVAVLMLVIGGLRYVLSGGDQAGVEGAKNTILYSVIGIVVAFMAYAIVNFVLGALD